MAQHAGSAGSFFRKPAPPAAPPPPTVSTTPAAVRPGHSRRGPTAPAGGPAPPVLPRHGRDALRDPRRQRALHRAHAGRLLLLGQDAHPALSLRRERLRRAIASPITAPPKELLLGFAKAFVVFFVPIVVLTVVRDVLDVGPTIKGAAALSISLLFLMFLPVAMVGARRYRLSRTSWRGIRFSFRGRRLRVRQDLRQGHLPHRADVRALLPVLRDPAAGVHDRALLLRQRAVRLRRAGPGAVRPLPPLGPAHAARPSDSAGSGSSPASGGSSGSTPPSGRPGSARRSRAARCSASGWSMPSCSSARSASPGRGCG